MCLVLARVYLTRFIGSHAARVAGIVVEPSTAHRLVAIALFLGGHSPKNWAAAFEAASDRAIRTGEIATLEERFLRAISYRLFVGGQEFRGLCEVLEKAQGHEEKTVHGRGYLRLSQHSIQSNSSSFGCFSYFYFVCLDFAVGTRPEKT
ncbi:hypothetical protein Zm00014a_034087 [Zea mays]|uniref:Uncharacterized protein n=1 Tax=Zea mays TaxID=4577 RepID=A0A3L6DX31_MAIZE|nr:hypothetical protein Zm00014a_034087 [Zea mays]